MNRHLGRQLFPGSGEENTLVGQTTLQNDYLVALAGGLVLPFMRHAAGFAARQLSSGKSITRYINP